MNQNARKLVFTSSNTSSKLFQRPLYLLLPSPGILFLANSSQYLHNFPQVSPNISPSEITTLATTLPKIILVALYSHSNSILFYFITLLPTCHIIHLFVLHFFLVTSVRMYSKSTGSFLCSLLYL